MNKQVVLSDLNDEIDSLDRAMSGLDKAREELGIIGELELMQELDAVYSKLDCRLLTVYDKRERFIGTGIYFCS